MPKIQSKQPKAGRPRKPRHDDPDQSKLFIQKAREIGADEESCGDALMGFLALTPPRPHAKPKAKSKTK